MFLPATGTQAAYRAGRRARTGRRVAIFTRARAHGTLLTVRCGACVCGVPSRNRKQATSRAGRIGFACMASQGQSGERTLSDQISPMDTGSADSTWVSLAPAVAELIWTGPEVSLDCRMIPDHLSSFRVALVHWYYPYPPPCIDTTLRTASSPSDTERDARPKADVRRGGSGRGGGGRIAMQNEEFVVVGHLPILAGLRPWSSPSLSSSSSSTPRSSRRRLVKVTSGCRPVRRAWHGGV